MTREQVFAFTGMPIGGEQYVRFVQMFRAPDGTVSVAVRDGAGKITEVDMPAIAAELVASALAAASKTSP